MDGNNLLLGTFIALALLAVLNLPVISSWAKRKKAFNFYPTLIIVHAACVLIFLLVFIGQSKKISVALENLDIKETSIESIGELMDKMKEKDFDDNSGAIDAIVSQEEAVMESRACILKVLIGVLLLVLAIENLLFVLVFINKYLGGTRRVRKYKGNKYSSVGLSPGTYGQGPYGKSESTPLGYSYSQAYGDSLSYEYSEKYGKTKLYNQQINQPQLIQQQVAYGQVAYEQQEEFGKTENLREIPKNYNNNSY